MWDLPWRLIFLGALIASAIGGAYYALDAYGDKRYDAGVAEVTNRWNAAEEGRKKIADEEVDKARKNAAVLQAAADAEAAAHVEALARAQTRINALAADGERLRALVRTIAGAARDPAPAAPATASEPDGATVALGGLLESCSLVAERLGGQAEGLADQVRGLQSYVNEVALKDGIKPK